MLLIVLLLAFGATVLVAGVTLTSRAGLVALQAESDGREGLAAADRALAELLRQAWVTWEPLSVELGGGWQGELSDAPGESGAVLSAKVVPVGTSGDTAGDPPWGYSVAALAELGHDGLDLPHAALVADSLVYPGDRVQPIAAVDLEAEPAVVHVGRGVDPVLLGSGIMLAGLDRAWRLDPGTLALATAESERPGSGIVALTDRDAGWYRLPPGSPGGSPEDPVLVVVAGGAGLDLRDGGDLFGVVVVDDAGLRLDGTRVHGAVFTSAGADMGVDGQILWSASLYRWATDRSVRRVRLVPGTRVEALFP